MLKFPILPVKPHHDLFNNQILSDDRVEFGNGQHIYAHKAVLARQSGYFFRAFTGLFAVASSDKICLGADKNPETITAMIRHIYDLRYDDQRSSKLPMGPHNGDIMFHIDAFEAADKYDVPSLRVIAVQTIASQMEARWRIWPENIFLTVERVCGPGAASFADDSLQSVVASFCSEHSLDVVKFGVFAKKLEKGDCSAQSLLIAILLNRSSSRVKTAPCWPAVGVFVELGRNFVARG
ncbi:hypothetical protein E4T42_04828 [Aureobasidium subglaciale]|nr:hypothetical protein E4T42_04828 [Aureobasidium subglaciale]